MSTLPRDDDVNTARDGDSTLHETAIQHCTRWRLNIAREDEINTAQASSGKATRTSAVIASNQLGGIEEKLVISFGGRKSW